MVFKTLTVRKEGSVLFAEIGAPPMNLLGPELVRSRWSCSRVPSVTTSSPTST